MGNKWELYGKYMELHGTSMEPVWDLDRSLCGRLLQDLSLWASKGPRSLCCGRRWDLDLSVGVYDGTFWYLSLWASLFVSAGV